MWIDALPHCQPAQAAEIARVHPTTLGKVVEVESGGNTLALRVNKMPESLQPHPRTTDEAIATAEVWISKGYKVDLGVMQIDSANLPVLGLTVRQILGTSGEVVCANLAAGASMLAANYSRAVAQVGPGQLALRYALSAYNTGNFVGGWYNGYLARYMTVPAIISPQSARVVAVATKRHSADTEVW